ncbi:hypothetical protein GXP67_12115 [Rhodocytophaga rosea]|uniref:Uncharacterized protein n=1 Tax=Rhodocytophaga rosea TaxID=2704465 RepID=A0A6C0GHF7_9BACT|nr:hypothetical protein [Rhodocytophaga rosea]QHT67325.1 hypothetical protein GXP67_12115 [Rhodocytophaga rosea]
MDQYQRGEANFILYDSLCKDQSNKIILLPWQPVFNGSVSAGNLKIVSFFSAVNNKTVFLTMDSLGQQVNRKEIEVKKAMQIPSLIAFSSPDGFFIISRSEKQWKDIIITKLDFQYNTLWERQFKQEKDPVTIDKLEKIGDKIFIFKQIRAGSKNYQGSLLVLDEKTGKTLLEKNLTSSS